MSMPVIVPGTGSREQAISDLIESVALEQTALSHILNAEGEKLQKILQSCASIHEILAANDSVKHMANTIAFLELALTNKLRMCMTHRCCREVEAEEAKAE